MIGPETCVGAIVVHEGDLLLVRRANEPGIGEWSIPGGRVRASETLAEAVVREVLEETGLEGICEDLVGWAERIEPGYHFVILDFRVTLLERGTPIAGDDAVEARWVSLSEVAELNLVEGLAEFLHDHGILDVIT
jgi:ADP-ribose pyrophosphatase YjhB (NUDIX family)